MWNELSSSPNSSIMISIPNRRILLPLLQLLFLILDRASATTFPQLKEAIDAGNMKMFKAALESATTTSIDNVNDNGRTALHYLARWSALDMGKEVRLSMVDALLSSGINLDVIDSQGKTALHLAAEMSYREGVGTAIVRRLIRAGANKNIQDKQGLTPLMHATIKGFENVGIILVEAGADVTATDHDQQYTVFLHASRKGRVKVVRALLEKKVDVHQRCPYGNTGIHLAEFAGHNEVADLIRKHGGIDYTKESEEDIDPELEKKFEEQYPAGASADDEKGPGGGGSPS